MTNVGFGRKCLIFPPEGYLSVKGDSSNQNTALFIYLFIDFVFWSIALFYPGFDFFIFLFFARFSCVLEEVAWRRSEAALYPFCTEKQIKTNRAEQ